MDLKTIFVTSVLTTGLLNGYSGISGTVAFSGSSSSNFRFFTATDTVWVLVNDPDLNRDVNSIEHTTVTVRSEINNDTVQILLSENSENDSLFTGRITISEDSLAVNSDTILQISSKDSLTALYVDSADGFDNVVSLSDTALYFTNGVSGTLTDDEVWKAVSSPYFVIGNLVVSESATLTLEPGVIVEFYAPRSGTFSTLLVNGRLNAIGTPTDSITFRSGADSPFVGDWGSIEGANLTLKYCNILHARKAINPYFPLILENSLIDSTHFGIELLTDMSTTITNNIIRVYDDTSNSIQSSGLTFSQISIASGPLGPQNIRNNKIVVQNGTGIRFSKDTSIPMDDTVSNNNISSSILNGGIGISIVNGDSMLIKNNTLVGLKTGIVNRIYDGGISGSDGSRGGVEILENTFQSCSIGVWIQTPRGTIINHNNFLNIVEYALVNRQDVDEVDATFNYWGTSITNEILAGGNPKNLSQIYDEYDDSEYSFVNYGSWLTEPYGQSINIIGPNGGEVFTQNTSINIVWNALGIDSVKIEYSLGGEWITIESAILNDGLYAWQLPDTISDFVQIKVVSVSDTAISDTSGIFSVSRIVPLEASHRAGIPFLVNGILVHKFEDQPVFINVFNLAGKRIKTLKISSNIINWYGTDLYGNTVETGIYFAQAISGNKRSTVRFMFNE